MQETERQKILALLASVPEEQLPAYTPKLLDFTQNPFDGLSAFRCIGRLPAKTSREIPDSMLSIGFETMDRDTFEPADVIPLLGKTGVKYARCQTGWIKSEKTEGVYAFGWLDRIVDGLLENGIQPWLSVSFGNPLYTPNDEFRALWEKYGEENKASIPGPARGYIAEFPLYHGERAMAAFIRYAAALAEHFRGRVQVYEIWNEPEHFCNKNGEDYAAKFGAKQLARDYTEFVRRVGAAIREADPDAKIAADSCGIGNSYIHELGKLGLANDIDIYAYHYYGNCPEASSRYFLDQLRACLDRPGKKVALWQGESGRASGNNTLVSMPTQYNQAKFMTRRVFLDASLGAELTSIFTASDFKNYYPDNSDQQYGLLTVRDVKPKLAYYVLQGLGGLFEGLERDPTILATYGAPPRVFEDTVNYRYDMGAFRRKGVPFFAVWFGGNSDIPHAPRHGYLKLHTDVDNELRDPIVIDPIRKAVYAVDAKFPIVEEIRPALAIPHFPLVDYPLLITDLSVFSDYLA